LRSTASGITVRKYTGLQYQRAAALEPASPVFGALYDSFREVVPALPDARRCNRARSRTWFSAILLLANQGIAAVEQTLPKRVEPGAPDVSGLIPADPVGAALVEIAARVGGTIDRLGKHEPWEYALWVHLQLRELDYRDAWLARMTRIDDRSPHELRACMTSGSSLTNAESALAAAQREPRR
jgi:phage tail protein X